MIAKALVASAAVIAAAYTLSAHAGLSSAEAHKMVDAGARLVDVRTPEEFGARHVPGAINIPVQELERRMDELLPKEKPIVLYCRSGRRSKHAADMLERAGFTAVRDLGAMSRW